MGITNMADEEDTGPKYNYEGDLQEGDPTLQDGRGHATYANCDEYEGEYKDGMRHGHGTYKWAKTEPEEDNPDVPKEVLDEDGKKMFISEYTGQYVKNLKDGKARLSIQTAANIRATGGTTNAMGMACTGSQTGTSTQASGDSVVSMVVGPSSTMKQMLDWSALLWMESLSKVSG